MRIGIPICEDIWGPDPVECVAETGGEILLVPNGSPYRRGEIDERLNIAVARVVESGLPLVYLNMVGGQDELVFEGGSFGLNADRSFAFQLPAFREAVVTTKWVRENGAWKCLPGEKARIEEDDEADYAACVLGLRDYVDKNSFKGVVFGLSGGINSRVVRRDGGRCTRCGPRARRDAALQIHIVGVARGCCGGGESARHSI